MNFSKFFGFLLLLPTLLITSCDLGSSNSESISNIEESSVSLSAPDSVSSSVPVNNLVEIKFDEEDKICDGTVGNDLSDVELNRYLAENTTYLASYSYGRSTSYRYVSSREESVTIEKDDSGLGVFKIKTHVPGDSILSIYDDMDMLVYRNIIRVRKAYDEVEIAQVLYDFDIYKGFQLFGNHRVTFTSTSPLTGILSGTDDVEITPMNIVFEASYVGIHESFDMHEFDLLVVSANEGSQTIVSKLLVARTGDFIILYYKASASEEAMLNLFVPISLESIHKEFF